MSSPRITTTPVVSVLLPIMAVVVVAYLVTAIAMPVLPLYVRQGLGLSTLVVGLVAGAAGLLYVLSVHLIARANTSVAALTLYKKPATRSESASVE